MGGGFHILLVAGPFSSQRSRVDPRFSIPVLSSWRKICSICFHKIPRIVFIPTSDFMSKSLSASSNTRTSKDSIHWLNQAPQSSFRTCPFILQCSLQDKQSKQMMAITRSVWTASFLVSMIIWATTCFSLTSFVLKEFPGWKFKKCELPSDPEIFPLGIYLENMPLQKEITHTDCSYGVLFSSKILKKKHLSIGDWCNTIQLEKEDFSALSWRDLQDNIIWKKAMAWTWLWYVTFCAWEAEE